MKKYDVGLRAFLKGNLGDDLFLYTICDKFKDFSFVTSGETEFKHCFDDIDNLTYLCEDSTFNRNYSRMKRIPAKVMNKLTKSSDYWLYNFFQKVVSISRKNVLISGSFFIENKDRFVIDAGMRNEEKYFQCKPYVMGCNFGPYNHEEYREFFENCFKNAKSITFRDEYSYNLFKGDNMSYAPDILFGFNGEKCIKPQIENYVVFSLLSVFKDDSFDNCTGEEMNRRKNIQKTYENKMADLAQKLITKGKNIVLLGFCNFQNDNKINERVYNEIKSRGADMSKVKVVNYPEVSVYEATGYLKYSDYIITTRYHGMILGGVFRKPLYVISYSNKTDNVIRDYMPHVQSLKAEDIGLLDTDRLVMEIVENRQKAPDLSNIINKADEHFKKLREDLNA